MKKRGSHLEIVISFIIFSFFLLFLLYFVQFLAKVKESKWETLSSAKLGFMEQVGGELTTFSVETDNEPSPSKDCFNVKNIINEIQSQGIDEEKLIIQNDEGDTLNYDTSGQGLVISTGTGFNGFLKFYYSNEITPSYCPPPTCNIQGCEPINRNDYEISEIRELEVNTIGNIEAIISNPYETLKSTLKIPDNSEIKLIFEKSDESTIEGGMLEVPKHENVYTERIHLIYTDTDGIKKVGFLTIMVW